MSKKISVIMGVFNCASTLSEAINSIIHQTYTNWELIICDDGSTDETLEVAKKFKAEFTDRITLICNEKNKGLNYTLNRCVEISCGDYLARMDGDDTCDPERFSKEVAVLEKYPQIAVVSTDMDCFDENGVWGKISHPERPSEKDLLRGDAFCHAPCMMRREAFDFVGGYSESKWLLRVEDYHLWMKMFRAGLKGFNIHESLYQMRDNREAYMRRRFKYRINEAYVKCLVVRELNLPKTCYLYAAKPVIVGLLPEGIYKVMHKRRLNNGRK